MSLARNSTLFATVIRRCPLGQRASGSFLRKRRTALAKLGALAVKHGRIRCVARTDQLIRMCGGRDRWPSLWSGLAPHPWRNSTTRPGPPFQRPSGPVLMMCRPLRIMCGNHLARQPIDAFKVTSRAASHSLPQVHDALRDHHSGVVAQNVDLAQARTDFPTASLQFWQSGHRTSQDCFPP